MVETLLKAFAAILLLPALAFLFAIVIAVQVIRYLIP